MTDYRILHRQSCDAPLIMNSERVDKGARLFLSGDCRPKEPKRCAIHQQHSQELRPERPEDAHGKPLTGYRAGNSLMQRILSQTPFPSAKIFALTAQAV